MKVLTGTIAVILLCITNTLVVANSIARPSCICPRIYMPICGSDNTTYANECVFNCTRDYYNEIGASPIYQDYSGECKDCSESCICTLIYAPVCGGDGQTYGSACQLNCKNKERACKGQHTVKFEKDGECDETVICPLIYAPVCGSDNNTYSNDCFLNATNIKNAKQNLKPITIIKQGVCTEPCSCPGFCQPVCGSDRNTYPSACNLGCSNREREKNGQSLITIKYDGECLTSCICPAIILEVCGSDGNTYANECELQCKSDRLERDGKSPITVKSNGKCRTPPCICTFNYLPVCGSDNVTYPNVCSLNCTNEENRHKGLPNIYVVSEGECSDNSGDNSCICFDLYKPVCGSDGKTYPNECSLNCANQKDNLGSIYVRHQGECPDRGGDDSCICLAIYEPVCGSDGVTYPNECALNCANQNNNLGNIYVKHQGKCLDSNADESCFCLDIYEPVCGSDGVTYPNECALNCANQKDNLGSIYVRHQGECPDRGGDDSCICLAIYEPVCGSDGVTYPNECALDCANQKDNLGSIYVKHQGECPNSSGDESCICLAIYEPVCGSDGVTYPNECALNCANQNNNLGNIYVKHQGECSDSSGDESCFCLDIYEPVCGSDGVTYPNECALNCVNQNNNLGNIYVKHQGECRDSKADESCFCLDIYEPVCGSDGVTYPNECALNCKNKKNNKLKQTDKPSLRVVHRGCCGECVCFEINDPICASDRNTYGNTCELNCENKIRKQQNQRSLKLIKKGQCKRPKYNCKKCPYSYRPVSGDDGNTYWNLCYLFCNNQC